MPKYRKTCSRPYTYLCSRNNSRHLETTFSSFQPSYLILWVYVLYY